MWRVFLLVLGRSCCFINIYILVFFKLILNEVVCFVILLWYINIVLIDFFSDIVELGVILLY